MRLKHLDTWMCMPSFFMAEQNSSALISPDPSLSRICAMCPRACSRACVYESVYARFCFLPLPIRRHS